MEFIAFAEEKKSSKDRVQMNRNDLFLVVRFGIAGDNDVETNQGLHLVYMHAGTNPFEVINQAVK